MSNLGKWNNWYKGLKKQEPYGDTVTYSIGAKFLKDCKQVEDWGCGKGWFRNFYNGGIYIGIDGSDTPWADRIEDLATYTSDVDGIFMRHVIEHNYEWDKVLENALASFKKKMVLVLFTPFQEETKQLYYVEEVGVPDMGFAKEDIEQRIRAANATFELREGIKTETAYGEEHVYLIQK